ncbi:Organic cation transporter 2, partial [Intoshia linei]
MTEIAFIGYTPKHRCAVNINDTSYHSKYYNAKFAANSSLDYKCSIISDNFTSSECKYGYVYSKQPIRSSITTEWDLVCKRNILPEVSQAVFSVGVMIGAIVFGSLADKYGRKRIFISCLIFQSLIGSCVSFATEYWQFVVLRVLVGCLEQGVNIIGYILMLELFLERERTIFVSSYAQFWAVGGMYMSLLAYIFRDWRPLQFAISSPWISAIVLIWILPESITWLISKNKIEEADQILQKSTLFYKNYTIEKNYLKKYKNSLSLDKNSLFKTELFNHKTKPIKYNASHLFKTPNVRKITICVCILWFFNVVTYFGWSFHSPNLYGNVYLNFFIGQVVESISFFITMVLISRYGRIKIAAIFHIVAGIACIVGVFIPGTIYEYNIRWIQIIFVMIAKLGFSITGEIIYMYTPEIFPTCLRTT